MPSMAPNSSPSRHFWCIFFVLTGLAELPMMRRHTVLESLLTRKHVQTGTAVHCLHCQLQALALGLFKTTPNVLTKEKKYMRMICFMQFQLSLLLRLHYYCQLSKSDSAPVDSSQRLTASVFLYDPPPFSSPLAKSSSTDICAALLLPVVKPIGTGMKKVAAHSFPTPSPPKPPPPQLFSKHVGVASAKAFLKVSYTMASTHTSESLKRFKSWSKT